MGGQHIWRNALWREVEGGGRGHIIDHVDRWKEDASYPCR